MRSTPLRGRRFFRPVMILATAWLLGLGLLGPLSPGTGAAAAPPLLWSQQFHLPQRNLEVTDVLVAGDRVFVGGWGTDADAAWAEWFEWVVGAFDLNSGGLLWKEQLLLGYEQVPVSLAADGGRLFVNGCLKLTEFGGNRGDWLMRAYDSEVGTLLWSKTMDFKGNEDILVGAAAAGSRLFVAGKTVSGPYDGLIQAYDAASGKRLWKKKFDYKKNIDQYVSLGLAGDLVVVGGDAEYNSKYLVVHAYAAKNGKLVWKQMTPGYMSVDTLNIHTQKFLAVAGGRVFAASGGISMEVHAQVLAYDAQSGHELWRQPYRAPQGEYFWPKALAAAGNFVAVAGYVANGPHGEDWMVLGLDAGTGALLWTARVDLGGDDRPEAVAVAGNQVVVAGYGMGPLLDTYFLVKAYDAATGSLLWTDQFTADAIFSTNAARTIAVAGNRVIVAGRGLAFPYFDWFIRAYSIQ